jgi:hypothetical protein
MYKIVSKTTKFTMVVKLPKNNIMCSTSNEVIVRHSESEIRAIVEHVVRSAFKSIGINFGIPSKAKLFIENTGSEEVGDELRLTNNRFTFIDSTGAMFNCYIEVHTFIDSDEGELEFTCELSN